MAFSYRWQDLVTLVSKSVKNIPTQSLDALHCDLVSSRIAARLPWKPLQTTIADGQIPLIDGQQDYDPPFNIWRLTDGSLRCTSVTPNDDVSILVRDSLPVDLYRRSPYAISSVSLEGPAGQLRLSSAPVIQQGAAWELRGSYQINPTKVVSTSQILWFDDRYVHVAVEGLTYWYYKIADDPRAGTTSGNWPGDISYSGQLAQFMSAIKEMADAEDIGGDMQVFPDDVLGIASSQYGAMVAAYGFGGGTGAGGTSMPGLISINNDLTPAQTLTGGLGVSITSNVTGGHLISLTSTAPNFIDNETVSGSGKNWVLAYPPSPSSSLQLFEQLPGFGQILLTPGVDYAAAGAAITTVNSLPGGVLKAYYRVSAPGSAGNFADNEVVSGSGTAWTLVHVPSPAASLQLFQKLTGFGQVLLTVGSDYTLFGANITTGNSLVAGALRCYYRF